MSNTPLPKTNVFHIDFNTTDQAGYMKATKVTLEEDVILDDETVRIDLADHPLYKKLQRYVKANPR